MADQFRRENRYLVIKHKDFDKLSRSLREQFDRIATKVCDEIREIRGANLECVVVESDWPEYEIVWQMIEARMDPDRVALTPAEAAQHWKERYLKQKSQLAKVTAERDAAREELERVRDEVDTAFLDGHAIGCQDGVDAHYGDRVKPATLRLQEWRERRAALQVDTTNQKEAGNG